MRIRQVKPSFWTDAKLRELSDSERLIYIGLWMEADDSGWLRWDMEQLAVDLFPYRPLDEAEPVLAHAGLVLSSKGRLRILKCGHAQVPNLSKHQRLAGATHQVHTIFAEHQRCSPNRARPRGSPRLPGNPRPVRLGQVRSGQSRARMNGAEENGVTTIEEHDTAIHQPRSAEEQAATWMDLWKTTRSDGARQRAEAELSRLGWIRKDRDWVKV